MRRDQTNQPCKTNTEPIRPTPSKYRTLYMRRALLLVTGAVLVPMAGCGSDTGSSPDKPPCPAISFVAVLVTVVDAQTKESVLTATGVIVDGSFRENLVADRGMLGGPDSREGTYTVIINAPGYAEFVRSGIEARPAAGQCPSSPLVSFVAELVRVP